MNSDLNETYTDEITTSNNVENLNNTGADPKEVIKRDGVVIGFDRTKIETAILKAMKAVNFDTSKMETEANRMTNEVIEKLGKKHSTPSVEEIQDMAENVIIKKNYPELAKAYILYRKQHEDLRNTFALFEELDMVDDYIYKKDWSIRENSNMNYSLQGLNNYVTSKLIAKYWLNKLYPKSARQAHIRGDIHIHQLNTLGPYCVGWDLRDLLKKGFRGVSDKIESKPPKHFRTALLQIVNFFYTLQGESSGAQAFSNFDTYLAPFIRYDHLSYNEVKQAMQEFIFNMNIPTRVGFQTPFTNLTMDLEVPNYIKNDNIIISGEEKSEVYGDFQEEVYMVNKAFAEIMTEGDASGRVFTFPIPTYNIVKGFDWDNPVYKEVWEMTAKYGIPYFANFVNSDMNPEDARSMCCRLRLDIRELKKKGGGLFGANPLTGSIGVITINLSRIGYTSKNEEEFFEKLMEVMEIAKEGLETKRKFLENATDFGLYPYSKFYLSSIKLGFHGYWKNHFSTIGLIGMNEAVLNFLKKDIGTKEGREFALKVLDFMREQLEDFQIKTGNIYNLEATPAESTAYDLAKKDKKEFSNIIVANDKKVKEESAEPYYTNSSLLPVNYSEDIIHILDLQDELQTKYTGGTVIHVFLGESAPSPLVVKKLVRKISENYKLPYYTITPTFSICPVHGYIFGNHEYCPLCKQESKNSDSENKMKCEVYSRIVGYLRPVSQWNVGKQEEFKDRKLFDTITTNL